MMRRHRRDPNHGGWQSHEAHELALFIENEGKLYPQKIAIIKNMHRKMKSGTYDHAKAPKAFSYLVEAGAKEYAKGYGTKWNVMFSKAARDEVARWMAAHEHRRIQNGDYAPEMPPVSAYTAHDPKRRPAKRRAAKKHPKRRTTRKHHGFLVTVR